MKFNRLRLVGFKSFVDAADILIEPGLTGVVGPNGCGKSNLVEGLRWVMGESSYKSLRASGMDDVIFAGSSDRPARNSAEVSLLIDNSARTAPARFNDSDTLEVTRRIEREAGSVYRVNGRDVRARDVQLLFADASTGAHSPALVRQGQIGEIIAAKPRDRRRILEEAAGISGLHGRRHEAELRLRAAEQNIERLDDVIAQLASQLDGLKRQARQAARYRALAAEIRRIEATLWHLRHRAALAAVGEAETALAAAAAEVERLTGESAHASGVRAEAVAALPQLRTREAEAGAALRQLLVTRDALVRETAQAEERAAELARRLEQTDEDIGRERGALGGHRDMIASLDREAAELEDRAGQDGEDAARLEARVAESEAALGEIEAALAEATDVGAEIAARRSHLERIVDQEGRRLTRLAGQVAEIDAEEGRLGGSDAAAEIAALSEAAEQARAAETIAEAAAEEAEVAHLAARDRREAARPPLAEAERDLKALETERETLAQVLAVDGDAAWRPIGDAVTVTPGYEAALGAALGDDLDQPADERAPIHWRAIASQADEPLLPEGATPFVELVTAPPELARRLTQTGLVEAADGPRLQALLKPGQRLVSKAGDLWRWDGLTAAADAPTAAARRLAQRNRLDELARLIAPAAGRVAELRHALDAAEAALAAAAAAATECRDAARAAQAECKSHEGALAAAERRAGENTARLSALAEARLRLNASLEESRAAVQEANTGLEALAGENAAALDARIAELKEEVAAARRIATEARTAREDHLREARLREDRRARIAEERRQWAARIADAEGHIGTLESRRQEIAEESERCARLPGELAEKRGRLADEIDRAEAARRAAADALAEGESALAAADAAGREADAALASAREEKARAEATLTGQRQRLADVEAGIVEALGRPASEARDVAELDTDADLPPVERLEADLERLKRDRDRLGSINLRAEEEMREVSGRHDELTAERTDLEAAIQKLRSAIQGLNREGRERLMRAFETVNGHFQALFLRLFGGGGAELKLVDSDDPLEAGLEIVARPPGKRAQVLTLLSGGEQALTATALIFAVFLTNPAPICILDEVDAPLDDANVERFCDLMDEMARTTDTRFLLITHNPITMSRVDRLFGVTMAERGVSQLVSVDIQGAERLREVV